MRRNTSRASSAAVKRGKPEKEAPGEWENCSDTAQRERQEEDRKAMYRQEHQEEKQPQIFGAVLSDGPSNCILKVCLSLTVLTAP